MRQRMFDVCMGRGVAQRAQGAVPGSGSSELSLVSSFHRYSTPLESVSTPFQSFVTPFAHLVAQGITPQGTRLLGHL